MTATPIDTSPTSDPPVSQLIAGIVNDAQTLIGQQVQMLRAEVIEDFNRSKRAAEFASAGIPLLTVGFLALVFAIAHLLHEELQLAMWISYAITGGAFLLCGGLLAAFSYLLLERFNPLPDKTLQSIQENLTWKRTR